MTQNSLAQQWLHCDDCGNDGSLCDTHAPASIEDDRAFCTNYVTRSNGSFNRGVEGRHRVRCGKPVVPGSSLCARCTTTRRKQTETAQRKFEQRQAKLAAIAADHAAGKHDERPYRNRYFRCAGCSGTEG